MANRIAGLDIGSWAIKAVVVELQRDVEIVAYREIRLDGFDNDVGAEGADGSIDAEEQAVSDDTPEAESAFSDAEHPAETSEQSPQQDDWPSEPSSVGGDWSDEGIDTDGEDGPAQWGEASEAGDHPDWAGAISKLVAEGFFEGVNRVITSFPGDESATLHLEVPFQRREDVEEVLPHLLMDKLPIAFDEVLHDFVVVPGSGEDDWEALVGFVRRARMRQFLDDCDWSGVDPAVVGVPELMLRYAGEQAIDPEVDNYGIIDFGHRYTRLLIMSEGKPVVAHSTRRAGAAITEAVAQNFQITPTEARQLKHREGVVGAAAHGGDRGVRKLAGTIEEALRPVVRDMRRSFQAAYAKYDVAVDEIHICGGSSRLEGFEEYLQGEFDVDVRRLDLSRQVSWQVGAQQRKRQPESTLAVATALQELVEDNDENVIDFRREEFVYRGKSSYLRTQLVRLGAVAAVLVVLLAGVLVMQHVDRRAHLQAMQQAVAEQTQELFGEPVTDAPEVQARLQGEGGADRGFIPQMSAYELKVRIIEEVSQDVPLELDRMEVDIDRSLVRIIGSTDGPQSVDTIASNIERLDCLSDVSKERVNVESDDEVQFELQIASGCS